MSQPIENPDAFTPANAYDLAIDVNMAEPGVEPKVWKRIRFTKDINPNFPAVTQDLQTYDDEGSPNAQKVGASGTCSFNVQQYRLSADDPNFLPEAERVRLAADPDTRGIGATREFRVYDKKGAAYAYQFRATVDWGRGNAGVNDTSVPSVTLTSAGSVLKIANPSTSQPLATVTAASPGTGPAGTPVTLTVTRAKSITQVKFGAANAPTFKAISDTEIQTAVPASGAAGSLPITVVNPAGTSPASVPFTKS